MTALGRKPAQALGLLTTAPAVFDRSPPQFHPAAAISRDTLKPATVEMPIGASRLNLATLSLRRSLRRGWVRRTTAPLHLR